MGNTVDIKAAKEFSLVDNMSLCVVISSVKQHRNNRLSFINNISTINLSQKSFLKMKIKNHIIMAKKKLKDNKN